MYVDQRRTGVVYLHAWSPEQLFIEEINELDTDAFMVVITTFMVSRGRPHAVIGYNGVNFVGSTPEFKDGASERDQGAMCERLARRRIISKCNPPGAPHFVEIWEKMICSCKKAMFAILGNRRLTLPVMAATVCLVEQTLHARPMTLFMLVRILMV